MPMQIRLILGKENINKMKDLVRNEVYKLEPYKPITFNWDLKMDANESPFDVPDEIKEEIWDEVKKNSFARYYDPTSELLREALALYTNFNKDQIMVGNGADEILSIILFTFAGTGREVIFPTPTFPIYETFTIISGAKPVKIPLIKPQKDNRVWELDYEKIRGSFTKDIPQVLILCYPNNPTGNYFDENKILELIEEFNGIVVIDEAYFEFGGKSFIPYLSKYDNLIIVRTFSKAFCLAGIRVGYLATSKPIIDELYKTKPPYNVNLFSQTAAKVLLKHTRFMNEVSHKLADNREYLYNELNSIDALTPYPSEGNFILTRFKYGREEVYNGLRAKRISIRKLFDEALTDCLRISVGSREEIDRLIYEMKKILEGLKN